MNTEDRITGLEIKFAHQDDTISELNDVIISQQKTIDDLESRILEMEPVVKSVLESKLKDLSKDPPPHY